MLKVLPSFTAVIYTSGLNNVPPIKTCPAVSLTPVSVTLSSNVISVAPKAVNLQS